MNRDQARAAISRRVEQRRQRIIDRVQQLFGLPYVDEVAYDPKKTYMLLFSINAGRWVNNEGIFPYVFGIYTGSLMTQEIIESEDEETSFSSAFIEMDNGKPSVVFGSIAVPQQLSFTVTNSGIKYGDLLMVEDPNLEVVNWGNS